MSLFSSLWWSRGIVVAIQGRGPPEVGVWAPRGHFVTPWRPVVIPIELTSHRRKLGIFRGNQGFDSPASLLLHAAPQALASVNAVLILFCRCVFYPSLLVHLLSGSGSPGQCCPCLDTCCFTLRLPRVHPCDPCRSLFGLRFLKLHWSGLN